MEKPILRNAVWKLYKTEKGYVLESVDGEKRVEGLTAEELRALKPFTEAV